MDVAVDVDVSVDDRNARCWRSLRARKLKAAAVAGRRLMINAGINPCRFNGISKEREKCERSHTLLVGDGDATQKNVLGRGKLFERQI